MPNIDLSILNQRQTPAFYADTLANRPAAGFVGRIFVSTDTFAFYRDNGTSWDLIGGPGTGTITGSGANGQVSYWNGASTITGSNDLFFDAVNGHLGIGTITPGTALDVHHDQSTVAILNQTVATNDTRLGFQNNGVGLWRIGAFYNAGANDFGIYDAVAAIQPITVKKTTGQVLIGTSNVGTGKLVVASATGDNGVQIVGATSPSLRIDNAEIGATKRIGIGLATAVNNFIQNSQNLDMCIFNSSTSAAGNMLFGIYDTGLANTQEAARISSARNFLIGTIVDAGQKLQVSGTGLFTGNLTTNGIFIGRTTNGQAFGCGNGIDSDLGIFVQTNNIAFSNSGTLSGFSFAIGGSTRFSIASNGAATFSDSVQAQGGTSSGFVLNYNASVDSRSWAILNDQVAFGDFQIQQSTTQAGTTRSTKLYISSAGNVGIGTTSPSYLLDVNGGGIFRGGVHTSGSFINGVRIGYDTTNNYGFIESVQVDATSRPLRVNQYGGVTSIGGNLLIGTTTDAGQKFQVNGTSLLSGDVTINASGNPTLTISGSGAYTGQLIINAGGGGSSVIQANGGSNKLIIAPNNVAKLTIGTTTINITSIPTSAVGLVSGDIYSNAGILTIVP